MKKASVPLYAAAVAILTAQARGALPLPPVRTEVVSTQGYVQRQSAGFGSRRQLTSVPQSLIEGQSLSCGAASRATIRFKDLSSIEIGPGSLLLLHDDKPNRTSASLTLGKLTARVTHIPDRRFEIATPAAVVRAVGTGFSVETRSPEETLVAVSAGEVAVQGRWHGKPVGDEVFLPAGQSVDIVRGKISGPSGVPRDVLNPELERQLDDEVDQMFNEAPARGMKN